MNLSNRCRPGGRESRLLVLAAMGLAMLAGFMLMGFFVFPIGITACSAAGMIYGVKRKDKLFFKGSVAAFVIGVLCVVYMCLVVASM